tara:strand:+ start:700 stop:861 length:162 start_codon:yes stop_codon:yes gene_type:complete
VAVVVVAASRTKYLESQLGKLVAIVIGARPLVVVLLELFFYLKNMKYPSLVTL